MSDNVNSLNSISSDIFPVAPNPETLRRARKREANRRDYQKHKERRRRNRPRVSELREREGLVAEYEARLSEYNQLKDREAQLINFIHANGLIPPDPPSMSMVFSSNTVSSTITYSNLFPSNEEVGLCENHASTLSSFTSSDLLFETGLYNLESNENEIELSETHAQTSPSVTFLDPIMES
ncbi:6720_t:CDS:2, partial [Cetraspora pellucida]